MSESVQEQLPFPELDIYRNASEGDVSAPQTDLLSLADKLDHINTAVIDSIHVESEERLVRIRRSWLEDANACLIANDFMLAITLLKYVIEDIEHSADHTHLDEAKRILDDCRDQQARAYSTPVLERTIHRASSS